MMIKVVLPLMNLSGEEVTKADTLSGRGGIIKLAETFNTLALDDDYTKASC